MRDPEILGNLLLRRLTAPGNRNHVTAKLLRKNFRHNNILPPRPSQVPEVSCHLSLHQPLGTGSLGWAVLALDEDGKPFRIERMGSRIFGTGRKPKDNTSLAADRTQARSMRRRRDRYLRRRNMTINQLVAAGLMPEDKAARKKLVSLHPFRLRSEGLHRELTLHELGRALFHLQQRRGFKSNRKADKGDSDSGAMKTAILDTQSRIPTGETVGSYLWAQILEGESARARRRGEGAKATYDFYVNRQMVQEEFDALWESQRRFHPEELDQEAYDAVHSAIFFQRALKRVQVGKCFFEREEERAADALPSSQLFRLYQEVNNLMVRDHDDATLRLRPLTRNERDRAIEYLGAIKDSTFAKLGEKLFGRASRFEFNLQAGERSKIKGNDVASTLKGKKAFGPSWFTLPLDQQDEIAQRIEDVESEADEEGLAFWLREAHGLSPDNAHHVATKVNLPDGHRRLSSKAIGKILPHLSDGWDEEHGRALRYSDAVEQVDEPNYRSHSEQHTGDLFEHLPYYGKILHRYTADVPRREDEAVQKNTDANEWEYGRIANTTVHIGLNQIRKVVNALINAYGLPAEVHVEVARHLGQSREARIEDSKRRREGEENNERIREILEDLGVKDNYDNRTRVKLFEELAPLSHRCIFTGIPIARARMFTNDYQVDHVLPYSRTLDDSYGNKILIHHTANQFKGNYSPFEAYGGSEDWDQILDRAEALPKNKYSRFSENAMERYEAGAQDFIARQLTDTAYLARVTKMYLASIVDPNHVFAMPGRLTGMLRAKWGLNGILSDSGKKERTDHRHHAIDGVVIALTDRSMLKRVTDANKRASEQGMDRLLKEFELPWDGFMEEIQAKTDAIVISHKPDHGAGGQLHEETAYGVNEGPDMEGRYLTHLGGNDAKWRRVIPIFRERESPDSAPPFKAYIGGSNYCVEIVRQSTGKWSGEVISTFQANQREYQAFMTDRSRFLHHSFSGLPLVMRLMADDAIAIEEDGERRIMRVCKIDSAGPMYFAGHLEGNVAARSRDKSDSFSMLKKSANPLALLSARRVFVDPLGNILDPGFHG